MFDVRQIYSNPKQTQCMPVCGTFLSVFRILCFLA